MLLNSNVIAGHNPQGITAPQKLYTQALSTEKYTLRVLVGDSSPNTFIGSTDLSAELECFVRFIPKQVANGRVVCLRDFSSFKPSLSLREKETPEKVGRSISKNVRFIFSLAAGLKRKRKSMRLRHTETSLGCSSVPAPE